MKKLLLLSIVLCSFQAFADCAPPQPSVSVPDGATATQDEMAAASRAFKQYNADVNTYSACLEGESKKAIEALTPKATQATEQKAVTIKNEAAHKQNAEVDKLTAFADKLKVQIQIYKARANKG